MKKVFIVLSNLLLSLFFVWVFTVWSDTYISNYYPNIAVFDSSPETNVQQVVETLDQLADQTDSLIAIQSQDPNSEGKPVFSYMTFGRGKLPDELLEKTRKEDENLSLETNYFIFKGDLDLHLLQEELSHLGLTNMHLSNPSHFSTLISVASNGFQLIGLLIFFLTFAALTLISQIGYLKTSGIRLISGERRWSIFLRPVVQDLKSLGIGLAVGGILTVVLKFVFLLPSISLVTIVMGLIVYNLLLLLIALFFAQLFAVGIKKVHLMQMIKGQIPVRGVIRLILMGQLLAVIIVSAGMGSSLNYSKAWQQQQQGQKIWAQEKELISLSISREGIDVGVNYEDMQRKQEVWYQLMSQAVSEQKALLSRHQLVDRVMQNGINSSKNLSLSTDWQDYSPSGNVLFVTPEYLKRQNISVDFATEQKLNRLGIGEFLLLLPDFLQSEEDYYKSVFEEDVTNRMSSKDGRQEMRAIVAYLESGKERFVYNTTSISYQQFLKDPIIVVVTPESTGLQSVLFWSDAVQNYVLFNQLSDVQELLERQGVKTWAGELQPAFQVYTQLLENIQRERWILFIGAALGIATSILLFSTMNRLYFAEFRRRIFIKRISGLGFLEIHRNYLLAQLVVFALGFIACLFLEVELLVALVVFLLFIILSILQLQNQVRKENGMSTLVLKGG